MVKMTEEEKIHLLTFEKSDIIDLLDVAIHERDVFQKAVIELNDHLKNKVIIIIKK